MGKPSRRILVVHAIVLLFVLLVGGQACSRKVTSFSDEQDFSSPPRSTEPRIPPAASPASPVTTPTATATPRAPPPVATVAPAGPRGVASAGLARGAPIVAGCVSSAPAGEEPSKETKEPEEPEPVNLAIAPQGGVPYHPEGTRYRSPFAKPNAKPLVVKVGTMLNSIDGYDIKTGKFTADFYLSLTSAEPMPKIELHCANGVIETQAELANRPTFKLYRMHGTFKSPPDLRKYPFDAQSLKIILEDDSQGIDQLHFEVDRERTTLAHGFHLVGWHLAYIEARSLSFNYGDRFENDDLYYERLVIRVGVERHANNAVFAVFVPAIVIVLISLMGMWVPPEEMEVRSNAGAPMLAAAVLFHYALIQELPATSYFMRSDKLMLGVYISLLLGMLSTWAMFVVPQKRVDQVFRVARVVVPVASVVVMVLACVL